jgi:hypothetical protein
MPYADKQMQRTAQNESNKRRRSKINETRRAHQARIKAYIAAQKNKPCADCGESFPAKVMDFHHVGEKLFELSKAANWQRKISDIDAEIAKCVLLCANCHRLRH